jgi:predicted Zn finger-like uncharacterized protein
MFTVCPKCALTLVVTAGDLKIGQGYVRCGRCSNVFNALVGLSDERQTGLMAQPAAGTAPPSGELSPPLAELQLDAPQDSDSESVPDSALEFNDSTDVGEVFIEARPGPHDVASGTFETIVLEADDLPDDASHAANDADAAEMQAANDAIADGEAALEVTEPAQAAESSSGFDRARIERPRMRRDNVDVASESAAVEAFADDLTRAGTGRSRGRVIAWAAAGVVLLVLFAAQLVHHYRHDLAVDGRFREPLANLYGVLGISLTPRWDLGAYDVRQLGASAGGAGATLSVRASVQNSGANPQPLPVLRVTVQDRFGNRIAARDVPPGEYARRAAAISEFLEVGERLDAEIRLADPGPNAVGFELDACLPFEDGRVACANERAR